MRAFHVSTEGYVNQEHRTYRIGAWCIFVRLVADQVMCMRENCGAWVTTHGCLSYQGTGLLVN